MRILQLPDHPVIERPVILEFQCADGMGHTLDCILNRMREVVHRVYAPAVARILMSDVCNPVNDRVPHIHIGGSHVDLCPKHLLAVGVLAVLHILEKLEIFLHAAVPVRTLLARLRQCPAVLADLLGGEVAHKGFALSDQLDGGLIHLLEIIGGEKAAVAVVRAQPLDILLDRFHELALLLRRVRVIKAEVELSMIFLSEPIVQKDRLCVADVEIAVRLRRKPGTYLGCAPVCDILVDDFFNEIPAFLRLSDFLAHLLLHTPASSAVSSIRFSGYRLLCRRAMQPPACCLSVQAEQLPCNLIAPDCCLASKLRRQIHADTKEGRPQPVVQLVVCVLQICP